MARSKGPQHRILILEPNGELLGKLARGLRAKGFRTVETTEGDEVLSLVRRHKDIAIIIMERDIPGMEDVGVLTDIRNFRPDMQVILLSSEETLAAAEEAGKLGVYRYFAKPVQVDDVVQSVQSACAERPDLLARHGLDHHPPTSPWRWLLGTPNSRPLVILLGALLFLLLISGPVPERLLDLVSAEKSVPLGQTAVEDINFGYAEYLTMERGESIAGRYSHEYRLMETIPGEDGNLVERALSPLVTANRAQVMLGVIVVAALFWATGAVPVGVTALLIAVVMYFSGIMRPDDIARAFARDAVVFIFGVLAISKAITKTGLDRRLGLLMLGHARNLPMLLFLFLPLLSVSTGFISEHALVAFTMPLFVMVYAAAVRESNIPQDRALMVLFTLSLCYAANVGGPGSPAAGGRNAIMIAILGDYGYAPSFGQWVKYGLPLVPVLSSMIALYFYLVFRNKIKVKRLNVAEIVAANARRIGPMTREEIITALVLLGVIVLWITKSGTLGMGGPVLLGLALLNITRVLHWKDIASIHWEVVFLYAGASAMGKGLAVTGGALFLADQFVSILPDSMLTGTGLAVAASLFTGLTTNFMSDGATVSALGPITVPMAMIGNVHPWMVGFATAYASSFAHMLIIGTPSNALAYAMAKDPVTGRQLVTLRDFFIHGSVVLLLDFAVLWGWGFFGYWRWIGFP